MKTIAAIDLGSNAMRGVIARIHQHEIEEVKEFRFPLRLGEEVFKTGKISADKLNETENAFIELFHSFMEYNVTEVKALATSAMREASNSGKLQESILNSTGIYLETISGNLEASLILSAVENQITLRKKTAVLMDIGGGSTEFTIIQNNRILGSKSFNVGTVRLLEYKSESDLNHHINNELEKILDFIQLHLEKRPDLFIGTGGNLRRIGKIRKSVLGKSSSEFASLQEIGQMEKSILRMSYIDRIRKLELDQNRADVILPAIILTHDLMKSLKMKKIILPKVGLKEGILLSMTPTGPKQFKLLD
ncbi:MAG: exopolyphosphatase [Bacteriovoracaceae bacterium]